jgi:hypothetical protein
MGGNVRRAHSIELGRVLDDIPTAGTYQRDRPLHLPEMAPIAQGLQSHDCRRQAREHSARPETGLLGPGDRR